MFGQRRYVAAGGPGEAGGQIRAIEGRAAGARAIQGHGAVFNVVTVIAGLFEEVIAPGAFTRAISEDDTRGLFNHDPSWILGRQSAGTLELSQDAIGLAYRIELPKTAHGESVGVAVDRRDVTGSSFSFDVLPDGDRWEWPANGIGLPRRTLLSVRLWDVGPVTFPQYPEADVASARQVLTAAEARSGRSVAGDPAAVLAAASASRAADMAPTNERRRKLFDLRTAAAAGR